MSWWHNTGQWNMRKFTGCRNQRSQPFEHPSHLKNPSPLKTHNPFHTLRLLQPSANITCKLPILHIHSYPFYLLPHVIFFPSAHYKQLVYGVGQSRLCGWPAALPDCWHYWNKCSYTIQPCLCWIGSSGDRQPDSWIAGLQSLQVLQKWTATLQATYLHVGKCPKYLPFDSSPFLKLALLPKYLKVNITMFLRILSPSLSCYVSLQLPFWVLLILPQGTNFTSLKGKVRQNNKQKVIEESGASKNYWKPGFPAVQLWSPIAICWLHLGILQK